MKEEKENNKKTKIVLAIVSILVFLVVAIVVAYFGKINQSDKELAYTELIQDINNEEIEKIKMTTGSTTITVTYKNLEGEEGTEENEKERQKRVIVPSLQAFVELVQTKVDENGLEIELIQENTSQFLRIAQTLFSLLPTILLITLMLMIFKMQGFRWR